MSPSKRVRPSYRGSYKSKIKNRKQFASLFKRKAVKSLNQIKNDFLNDISKSRSILKTKKLLEINNYNKVESRS